MVDATQFLALYPQFSSIELHLIQYQLNYAASNFCSNWVEPRKSDGIILIAAHNLTLNWLQEAEIASAASGIASGSGSQMPSGQDNPWNQTVYGRQYLALRDTAFVPPILIL